MNIENCQKRTKAQKMLPQNWYVQLLQPNKCFSNTLLTVFKNKITKKKILNSPIMGQGLFWNC